MTFREMIKLYKEGKLNEEQEVILEQEIEKHEAISEYLCDEDRIPEIEEILENTAEDAGDGPEADGEFVRMINQSIRRAFRRLGLTVLAVTLALVLFIQFCLPKIVSLFFYNPLQETVHEAPWGEDIQNQMSLDMAVYSELFLPGMRRTSVEVEAKGYGKYDFCIRQNYSRNGVMTDVSGEITRGTLKYYDSNVLKEPTTNCFVWYQAIGDLTKPLDEGMKEEYNMCAAGKRKDALTTLDNLDEDQTYIGFVSLNQMMDYETFVKFAESQEITIPWCAVKTSDITGFGGDDDMSFHASNIGFDRANNYNADMYWDREKYPELILGSFEKKEEYSAEDDRKNWEELDEKMKKEAFVQTHFVSQLRYMADQEKFIKMLGKDRKFFTDAADYVEENGVSIYGFAAWLNKEEAKKLSAEEEVYEIYMTEMR